MQVDVTLRTYSFDLYGQPPTSTGGGVSSWDDLQDKPATFPPSTHNHDDLYYTDDETDALLAAKSDTGHTHDDRYYTESEVTALLANKLLHPYKTPVNSYFLSSRQIGTGYTAGNISSTALNANNRGRNTPFVVDEEISVDAMAIYLVALNAGAGAVLRLGIFRDDGSGHPGDLIVDAGTASVNSTGLKTLTFSPVTLTPGRYHAVIAMQSLDTAGANPTFACVQAATAMAADTAPAGNNNMLPYYTYTASGAFSNNSVSTPSINRGTNAPAPHIWIRRQA